VLPAYGLLRFGGDILGPGLLWSASVLRPLAVLAALFAVSELWRQNDLRAVVAHILSFQATLVLLGLASLTAIGMQGAQLAILAASFSAASLSILFGYFEHHVGVTRAAALAGMCRAHPALTLLGFAGFATAAALPGSAGAGALLRVTLGAFPGAPGWVLLALCVWLAASARLLGLFRRVFGGAFADSWQKHPRLEAHGGSLPALRGRELAALAGLSIAIWGMGFAPRLLLCVSERTLYDLAARLNRAGPAQIAARSAEPHIALVLRQTSLF
jgi:NADH-quinone oxidoreductase subunit M